jgi:hypothetical protein
MRRDFERSDHRCLKQFCFKLFHSQRSQKPLISANPGGKEGKCTDISAKNTTQKDEKKNNNHSGQWSIMGLPCGALQKMGAFTRTAQGVCNTLHAQLCLSREKEKSARSLSLRFNPDFFKVFWKLGPEKSEEH